MKFSLSKLQKPLIKANDFCDFITGSIGFFILGE